MMEVKQQIQQSKRLPIAKNLTDAEYQILLNTYQRHNRSMGLSERDKYSISNIKKVQRYAPDAIIKVYYKNGDWWHYTKNGTWY